MLIFENAFIPWENVLVYRDPERANSFYRHSRFVNRYTFQSSSRLAVKLDLMVGLFAKGIETNGTDAFRGVQAALGEIIGWRNLIWGMTAAMCADPENAPGGHGGAQAGVRLYHAPLLDAVLAGRSPHL